MKDIKVFILTETKVDATYPTAQFKINGYDIRNDRTKGGGAILVFVSSRTPSKKLARYRKFFNYWNVNCWSQIWKTWCSSGGNQKTPKTYRWALLPQVRRRIEWHLQLCFIIFLGDLNLDRLRPERRQGKILLDLEDIHGYSCLIDKPTRITEHSQTLLDTILTNKPYLFQGFDVFNTELSDHALVYRILKIKATYHPSKIITFRNLKNHQQRRTEIWSAYDTVEYRMLEISSIQSRISIASGTSYWIMSWMNMRRL